MVALTDIGHGAMGLRDNLRPIFGLIAAAALLIDYVMTVAVSLVMYSPTS